MTFCSSRGAILSYSAIGHNLDIGTFDPFRFVVCDVDEALELQIDIVLLQQGSAVALLCQLQDALDDWGFEAMRSVRADVSNPEYRTSNDFYSLILRIIKSLDEGSFKNLPLAEAAAEFALTNEEKFRQAMTNVYTEYVVSYMKKLSAAT